MSWWSTHEVDILWSKFDFLNYFLDQIGEESNGPIGDDEKAVDNSKGPLFFGLSPTNPQDWITVVLTGIIVYETFDLVVFWFQKLTGFQGFQAQWNFAKAEVIASITSSPELSFRRFWSDKLKIQHFNYLNNCIITFYMAEAWLFINGPIKEPWLVTLDIWMIQVFTANYSCEKSNQLTFYQIRRLNFDWIRHS